MRTFKKLGVLAAVFALSAITAATASAAEFTASATGSFIGKATETQVFTTNGGQIKCTGADSSGSITSTASAEWHETVIYKGCSAFGFANVHTSPATFLTTADGTVHLLNTVTIVVTVAPPFVSCHITYLPQTWRSVGYSTNGSRLRVTPNVSGMTYTSSGGFCGSSGSNGTFTGSSEIERVGGGSLAYHP